MGMLVDGKWSTAWYDTKGHKGRFVREEARFRNWVTNDGSAGPGGQGGFKAESGRYHLYVSYACPWAHRTLLFRALKNLEPHVSVSVVHPLMADDGWTFATDFNGATGDTLNGHEFLRDVYLAAEPKMTGRVTVPVLWDCERRTIVSNESSEIIRMFNSAFGAVSDEHTDYAPPAHLSKIDAMNEWVYRLINNGVYRAGFATTQEAYEEAVVALFGALDDVDRRLQSTQWLVGDLPSEADWRLFATLVRFDPVYVGHFKCNLQRIADYSQLPTYCSRMADIPKIAQTIWLDHIKTHYYASHLNINPTGIVPLGPRATAA